MGDDTSFSALLRNHRKAARLTQEELARRSGLSVRAVADLERGRTTRPHRRSVALLAEALALSGDARALFIALAPGRAASGGTPEPAPARKPAVAGQLPAAGRYFVGRTAELAWLANGLDRPDDPGTVPITVIAGMAGVGKTALAVRWAHMIAPRFPDGQLYVDLHGFTPSGTPTSSGSALCDFLLALRVPAGEIPPDSGPSAHHEEITELLGTRIPATPAL